MKTHGLPTRVTPDPPHFCSVRWRDDCAGTGGADPVPYPVGMRRCPRCGYDQPHIYFNGRICYDCQCSPDRHESDENLCRARARPTGPVQRPTLSVRGRTVADGGRAGMGRRQ